MIVCERFEPFHRHDLSDPFAALGDQDSRNDCRAKQFSRASAPWPHDRCPQDYVGLHIGNQNFLQTYDRPHWSTMDRLSG